MTRSAQEPLPHGEQGRAAGTVLLRYRIFAALSLLCSALAGLLLLVGVALEFPEFLLPLSFTLLALWMLWRTITRRGLQRILAALLLLLCAIVLVWGFVWAALNYWILLGIGLALICSSALSSLALSWSRSPTDLRSVKAAHHPVLFINPKSGGGAAEQAGLQEEAARRFDRIKVVVLDRDADLAQLAQEAVASGADCLGIAGGDGSLAVVAEVAMQHKIPFVCVPAGTRNHFAMDLGLDRSDLCAALDAFGSASEWSVDVATVNNRTFVNNVSLGAYGKIVAADEYRDNKLSTVLSRIPDLLGPDSEHLDLCFVDASGTEHESAVVIHVSNNSYDLGSPSMGGRASISDGKLGVFALVQPDSVKDLPVLHWEAEDFVVRSSGPISAGIDGEYALLQPPLQFEIKPKALRVRVPRSVRGISPTAKKPSFSKRTLIALGDVARGRWPRTHSRVSLPMRPR